MGTCIICGTPVDGRVCDSHQEDVVFEFRGNDPNQLVQNRFYRGTVDGYAEFGVFVDLSSNVTGLLHRSELDQRLESLDWEPGDDVFVQVKNVRDNGDVDLAWSIRQADREFRGALVQEGTEEKDAEQTDDDDADGPVRHTPTQKQSPGRRDEGSDSDSSSESDSDSSSESGSSADSGSSAQSSSGSSSDSDGASGSGDDGGAAETADDRGGSVDAGTDDADEPEPEGDREPAEIGSLGDRVGETVRIEGEVVSARQTGGPTVFELRDETGVVDCAAFVEAGVRAYPEVDVGDMVRLDGEIEVRRNEIQVETEALAVLAGEEREAVEQRLADALTAEARPDSVTTVADHESLDAVGDDLLAAAEAVRRAVLESRPIVVRHAATADGYVAGAAVERAVLPLVRDEHAKSDAEYHYFTRRPLEDMVYDMDDATNDVTRMLQDRDRHGEKLPLVLLLGIGSTVESEDGLGLLGVYGADRVVVDAVAGDAEVRETVETLVNPDVGGTDGSGAGAADDALTTGALAATLAATVNDDVADDLAHLPAVSYWEGAPDAYVEAADGAGFDADRVAELREAIALEAFYQSYEDKRELITDILFGGDDGALAGHISEQFREKLGTELDTAEANLETREAEGVEFAVLDADAYAHRYDFPPTALLADELHRRGDDGGEDARATLVFGVDELYLRASDDVDVRAVADDAAEAVPDGGVTARGVREGRIEFLAGRRGAVTDAVVEAAAARLD
ncbi:DHH family phosphoesterase [Candidatus Halobonum tyrrellensis]|uniref:OB-fold tRNA/helicase-type nucleic acid binding protein n=1 Tax=Candidatus Halobonum tyrrellensis G22 TaxID=1324957 RepID=V4HH63_9EURY|nr:OB-fold nucleic acid binding domain-containing protein [Candidatus Halobonum tyrrellensis]ESP87204.1 OB-fold tRNA/helicase-type nucleic acid binding protein [Candidatus Halobonum tyrrellensis G22]